MYLHLVGLGDKLHISKYLVWMMLWQGYDSKRFLCTFIQMTPQWIHLGNMQIKTSYVMYMLGPTWNWFDKNVLLITSHLENKPLMMGWLLFVVGYLSSNLQSHANLVSKFGNVPEPFPSIQQNVHRAKTGFGSRVVKYLTRDIINKNHHI